MRDYLFMLHHGKPRITVEERNPVDVTRDLCEEEIGFVRDSFAKFDEEAQRRHGGDYIKERDDYIASLKHDQDIDDIKQSLHSNQEAVVGKLDAHHSQLSIKLDEVAAGKGDVLSAVGELKNMLVHMEQRPSNGPQQSAFQWAAVPADQRQEALARMKQELASLEQQIVMDAQLEAERVAADVAAAERALKESEKASNKQSKKDEAERKKAEAEQKKADRAAAKAAAGIKRKASSSARGGKKPRSEIDAALEANHEAAEQTARGKNIALPDAMQDIEVGTRLAALKGVCDQVTVIAVDDEIVEVDFGRWTKLVLQDQLHFFSPVDRDPDWQNEEPAIRMKLKLTTQGADMFREEGVVTAINGLGVCDIDIDGCIRKLLKPDIGKHYAMLTDEDMISSELLQSLEADVGDNVAGEQEN